MQRKELLQTILHDLDRLKAINIHSIDVRELTSVTDYMVIATGNSGRHVNAIAQNLIHEMKLREIHPFGVEADQENQWVLVNLCDVVVHIMQESTRNFYHLEKLWTPLQSDCASYV